MTANGEPATIAAKASGSARSTPKAQSTRRTTPRITATTRKSRTRRSSSGSDELAAGVDPRGSARERGDQVAAVLSASLARQTMLCDLINAQTNVLEHNVSVEVVVQHKRSAIAGIATASDLVRRHVPELGDGARPVSMTTLILAGALSSYCRPSASALAAYEADPTVLKLRLDLRTALESAVATLIAGTLARF